MVPETVDYGKEGRFLGGVEEGVIDRLYCIAVAQYFLFVSSSLLLSNWYDAFRTCVDIVHFILERTYSFMGRRAAAVHSSLDTSHPITSPDSAPPPLVSISD